MRPQARSPLELVGLSIPRARCNSIRERVYARVRVRLRAEVEQVALQTPPSRRALHRVAAVDEHRKSNFSPSPPLSRQLGSVLRASRRALARGAPGTAPLCCAHARVLPRAPSVNLAASPNEQMRDSGLD